MSELDESKIASFEEFFTRPPDEEMIPVLVHWQTGGSSYDYICTGLALAQDVLDWMRGNKPPTWKLLVWEPQTVIKYNSESGSLAGSATHGPKPGGYGFKLSQQAPAAMGAPLEIKLMTGEAWDAYRNWADVAGT